MLRLGKLTDYGTVITAHMGAFSRAFVLRPTDWRRRLEIGISTASKDSQTAGTARLCCIRYVAPRAVTGWRVRPGKFRWLSHRRAGRPGPVSPEMQQSATASVAQEQGCAIRGNWQNDRSADSGTPAVHAVRRL